MSKITQALEKAARERLQREQATAPAANPVTVPLLARKGLGDVAPAGHVRIDPHIVSAADPESPIAEQYRILRTNLQSLRMRSGSRVIVVTSAVNGEGKSVTALNLALALARQEHLKVALVDADLRRSSIHRWLGLERRAKGLSIALQDGGELDGLLVSLGAPQLAVLLAGPAVEQPAELLESLNMKRVLAALRARFDFVIVDAPPVLPVADPGILAAQADGVLLVVRAGRTQRKAVLQAQETLKRVKANVVGCVLTHMVHDTPGYYRYYHASKDDTQADGQGAVPTKAAG